MTSLFLPVLIGSFTLLGFLARADHQATPREQALGVLNSWNSTGPSLDPEGMGEVLENFARVFAIGPVDLNEPDLTTEQWTSRLFERLAAETDGPLRDARVREVIAEFMKRHGVEFRAAYDLAREYHAREFVLSHPRNIQVAAKSTPQDWAVACGLILASFGGTVGGGLATAWVYGTPYGALAGLAPMGLYAGWRYANYFTRGPQLQRRATQATPVFQRLLDAQKSFAASP